MFADRVAAKRGEGDSVLSVLPSCPDWGANTPS